MRILILTQFFDPEPASIPGMPLALWLTERGHEVEVVTGFPNYPGGRFYPDFPLRVWKRESVQGVRVNRVILFPSHDRSAIKRILSYVSFALSSTLLGTILSRRPDVVYVYHPPATIGLTAMLWKLFRRVPFVYHVQDLWPDSVIESGMAGNRKLRMLMERAISWWCRQIYRSASAVIVLSNGFKDILIERGVPSDHLVVIPNWTEESVYFPVPRNEPLASELGLAGRFNVMYSGNVGYYQNLDSALRAFHLLRELPDVQLVIVGTGQAIDHLKELAEELNLNNVLFLGRRPYQEMAPLTALADILLVSLQNIPFFRATIPSKTQVALACGRPVLMAVRGDAADLVKAAGAGEVCAPGDEVDLAGAIRKMRDLPAGELAAMGERGRAYYLSQLSLARGGSQLEAVLKDAAATAGRC